MIEERFDRLEKRFDLQDAKFDRMEKMLTQLITTVANVLKEQTKMINNVSLDSTFTKLQ